jgi:hypothetical protein
MKLYWQVILVYNTLLRRGCSAGTYKATVSVCVTEPYAFRQP